jgi:hypothetical protein
LGLVTKIITDPYDKTLIVTIISSPVRHFLVVKNGESIQRKIMKLSSEMIFFNGDRGMMISLNQDFLRYVQPGI